MDPSTSATLQVPNQPSKEPSKKPQKLKADLGVQSFDQIPTLQTNSLCVISRQATINIGTIGHVSHGKTTVVKAISGVNTIRFTEEMKQNITIQLGYANTKIYKCPKCPEPQCYKSYGSGKEISPSCDNQVQTEGAPAGQCGQKLSLLRHISFVDCPGHDNLMATMLTGAAVIDAALLLIAGNLECPQPQTSEHLAALDIMDLNSIIILQNKVDLIFRNEGEAARNYRQIVDFIKGTRAENSPIIPISAQFKYNIDVVLQYLVNYIPTPIRDLQSSPQFMVVRSFDVNKPGFPIEELSGGIVGGSILKGILKVGDEIEIRPGILNKKEASGNMTYKPIVSKIVSMNAEENELQYAIPGGLIGIGLTIDPYLTKRDYLVGRLLGHKGTLPAVYSELNVKYQLLNRLLGVQNRGQGSDVIQGLQKGDILMINVGTTSSGCEVIKINSKEGIILVELNKPVCASIGDKVALSKRNQNKFRLIGWGKIQKGKICNPVE